MTLPTWRRHSRLSGADPAADVKDELRFHLEAKIDDLVRQGWNPQAARSEAERQFGDVRAIEEIGQTMGGKMERRRRFSEYWSDTLHDARYALRTLRRDRGFTAVALLILALAVGANISVFSVVNTLLLRPLPFPDSQRLVWIAPPPQTCGFSCSTYSADAYDAFRSLSRSYADVTGYEAFTVENNFSFSQNGDSQPATAIEVIYNFFQVLGVRPELGRTFAPEERLQNAHPVVLLADPYWRRQFAADPSIVGKEITLNGKLTTVIGVLPASFDFGAVFSPGKRVDLIVPLSLDFERNFGNIVTMLGRLKPDTTLGQAQSEAYLVAPHLCWSNKYPQSCGQYAGKDTMQLRTLKDYVSGHLHRSLIVLWSAVGVILLIACVNLSNLLLARAAARSKEFAIRGALGASRVRIVGQLLVESLVLSCGGSVLGLGLAYGLLRWLAHQGSLALPLLGTVRIDGQALVWTICIAVLAAFLFGLVPGLRMAAGNLQEALKDSGPGAGLGRKHERIRAVLVASEVALACVLLVGAGLLLRSFMKVLDIDLGFQPDRAASIRVEYDDSAPNDAASSAKRGAIFRQMIERVGALPGVEAAGIADFLPLGPNRAWGSPVPKGKVYDKSVNLPSPLVYVVTPGFFHAMGMRIRGRDFTWDDVSTSPRVALIDASAARFYWPGEDAVGKVLTTGGNSPDLNVIGVVDDVHADNVEHAIGWQIYYPVTQEGPDDAQLVVRSQLPPASLAASVLQALRELNPKQTAAEFRPVRTIVDRANSPRRFFMLLVAAFAGLGLLLAALGIYGVISYSVTRQTQEIGIRMALGASAGRVQRDVVLSTLRLAGIGLAFGTIASLVCARVIATLLFSTSPWDAATYGSMIAVLILVALISGYLPARRASRIDPMTALRNP
jgi:predicted permease